MNTKRAREEIVSLQKMTTALFILAGVCTVTTYFLPNDETNYWLSANGKQGFYVLSALFFVLGLYCCGAICRRT